MKRALILASSTGFFGTILVILLGYADYYSLGTSIRHALTPVWQWPLFGMSLVLTALSISIPFVAHFFRDAQEATATISIYAFGFQWLLLFVFYPGTRALGVTSDSAGLLTWIGVCVIQYIAATIVLRAIRTKVAGGAA